MKGMASGGSYRGMEIWWLAAATLLAGAGAGWSWYGLRREKENVHALWWMVAAFACQLVFLQIRGEARGKCPLQDTGEVLAFLAWSINLFYLVTGPTYRLSLLGLFTAPLVAGFQLVALIPGVLDKNVERIGVVDPWKEAHAAFSVMSYGALGLAAVAAVMFLVLDARLKAHRMASDLTRGMPSIHALVGAMGRIALVGWVILTVGVVTGFLAEGTWNKHLVVALAVWAAYAALLGVYFFRGVPPRLMGLGLVGLFVVSLVVFGKI